MFKKRNRQREIEFEKIEILQEKFGYTDIEMAELLGLTCYIDKNGVNKGSSQFYNYRKSGMLPATKYYTLINALRLNIEQEAIDKRQILDEALGILYQQQHK